MVFVCWVRGVGDSLNDFPGGQTCNRLDGIRSFCLYGGLYWLYGGLLTRCKVGGGEVGGGKVTCCLLSLVERTWVTRCEIGGIVGFVGDGGTGWGITIAIDVEVPCVFSSRSCFCTL